jgi:fucose permease
MEEVSEKLIRNIKQVGEIKYRYVILVCFCLLSFSNAMNWVTYSSIHHDFKTYFKLTNFQVHLYSILYMAIYPFVNFISSWIIDNKSMRIGVKFIIYF